jgi:hypothetical protein
VVPTIKNFSGERGVLTNLLNGGVNPDGTLTLHQTGFAELANYLSGCDKANQRFVEQR